MPRQPIDLTGKRFGKLVAEKYLGPRMPPLTGFMWQCRCDCGIVKPIDGSSLRRGFRKSCGCTNFHTTHGMAEHPLYSVWLGIKQRCNNPNSQCFKDYGERGVKMCERWRDSFAAFYEDMGDRPTPTHTIERNDNAGNYEPGNCRWATRADQNENTRQTRLLTYNGITLSIGKWARRLGVDRTLLKNRLNKLGWTVEQTLSTPKLPMGTRNYHKSP